MNREEIIGKLIAAGIDHSEEATTDELLDLLPDSDPPEEKDKPEKKVKKVIRRGTRQPVIEKVDPEKLEAAEEAMATLPAEIEQAQKALKIAGAYVARHQPRSEQPSFASLVKGFQKSVIRGQKQQADIAAKVTAAVKKSLSSKAA